jgi:hypothetical protein
LGEREETRDRWASDRKELAMSALCSRAILYVAVALLTVPTASVVAAKPDGGQRKKADPVAARDSARTAFERARVSYENGDERLDAVYRASRHLLDTELALTEKLDKKIALAREYLGGLRPLQIRNRDVAVLASYVSDAEALIATFSPEENRKYQAVKKELGHLNGRWRVSHSDSTEGPGIAVIDGHKMALRRPGSADVDVLVTIDPLAEPKRMEVYGFDDDYLLHYTGIYRLADDTITLYSDLRGAEYPKDFSAVSRVGEPSFKRQTFKRVKVDQRGKGKEKESDTR